MIIEVHWSYSLLFAAKDGEDGNGLKLKKTGQLRDSVFIKTPKIKYE